MSFLLGDRASRDFRQVQGACGTKLSIWKGKATGQCTQLTVHLGNLCTAWTTVDEHSPTERDSALSIILILLELTVGSLLHESRAYLILNKSEWHASCVTSNLNVASAVLEKCNMHMMLKLIVRLRLNKANFVVSDRSPRKEICVYFATNTQALGGSMA